MLIISAQKKSAIIIYRVALILKKRERGGKRKKDNVMINKEKIPKSFFKYDRPTDHVNYIILYFLSIYTKNIILLKRRCQDNPVSKKYLKTDLNRNIANC